MKLRTWAEKQGISYKTAWRLFRSGALPVRSEQLSTGTILVYETEPISTKIAIYVRVSSRDQLEDLDRQLNRLRDFCASKGWTVAEEVREIGSGLNGKRKKLISLLSDPSITHIVVEHRDRLCRFGFDLLESTLSANKRKIVVLNEGEIKNDLVRDFVEVVTCMCARIYGKRSARNRAARAIKASEEL
jgi:putative resolvase